MKKKFFEIEINFIELCINDIVTTSPDEQPGSEGGETEE